MLYEGKVTTVSRLNNSYNGNPRYAVTLECDSCLEGLGRFNTPIDAGWVYGVNFGNLEGRIVVIDTGATKKTIQCLVIEGEGLDLYRLINSFREVNHA